MGRSFIGAFRVARGWLPQKLSVAEALIGKGDCQVMGNQYALVVSRSPRP